MKRNHKRNIKQYSRKAAAFLMTACLLAGVLLSGCAGTSGKKDAEMVRKETAQTLMNKNPDPGISSVGGEWLVMGLLYSGIEVPDSYYSHYYDNVRAEVKSKKGVLTDDHYTEYERLLICLSALGKDTSDIEGYDLRPYLDEYDKVSQQGANSASFALIAAKVCGYKLENEERYIQQIIEEAGQTLAMGADGLSDYVAMGAEALSFYAGREDVDAFLKETVRMLSESQKENGALNNCEATAECIFALSQLGIDPDKDERFIKNGNTLEDGILSFYAGDGQFFHDEEAKEADALPTEKGLLALDTLARIRSGQKLYEAK